MEELIAKTTTYIDGFTLPIPRTQLDTYRQVAASVARIWIEHGALNYFEFFNEAPKLEGTRSFPEALGANEDEVLIFGWAEFESRASRDFINKKVMEDARMKDLLAPITDPSNLIFDAKRMVYGGFERLV